MPQIDAIDSSRSLNRPMMNRKGNRIPLAYRHYLRPRLHSRTLFSQHELSSGKIPSRLREQKSYLDRKDMLSIKVLMQAVVVTNTVLKKKWSRAQLSGIVAAPNEVRVFTRIPDLNPHRLVPSIGNGSQLAIKRSTQTLYDARQWITEILVLSAPKAVTTHDHSATKSNLIRVQACKCLRTLRE